LQESDGGAIHREAITPTCFRRYRDLLSDISKSTRKFSNIEYDETMVVAIVATRRFRSSMCIQDLSSYGY